jgi:hypothetical protein
VGGYQACLLEDLQVLGDRLLGNVDLLGDLADRARPDADQAQDCLPAGLREGFQDSFGAHDVRGFQQLIQVETCESGHLRSVYGEPPRRWKGVELRADSDVAWWRRPQPPT